MTDHCPTCGAAVCVEVSGVTHYMIPIDAERVRELEAALEQSKERLSAARLQYERPIVIKALGLQKRVRELEEGLRHIRDSRYSAEAARDIAAKTLDGKADYREPPQ